MDFQIQLKQILFTEVVFRLDYFDQTTPIPFETNLGVGTVLSPESENDFLVFFDLKLEDKEKKFSLSLKVTAAFETDKPLDKSFIDSPFAKINAPAIAFPYIRTFISNFTLNSGLNPIILPSFNFVKMAEEKMKEKTS